jgi:hypothetical protein
MSLYETDISTGLTNADNLRRRKIYEMVALYVLSAEDILTVKAIAQNLDGLWLATFTNSQKEIIANLFNTTKTEAL